MDRRLEAEGELRTERERQERELLLLEKEQELERLRVQHEREMYLIKKKLSVVSSPPPPKAPLANPLTISIPRYHTVGVGKTSFVEYEVVVVEMVGGKGKVEEINCVISNSSDCYGCNVSNQACLF